MNAFVAVFLSTFASISQIAIVAFVAAFLARRNVVTQTQISVISRLAIQVFLPCLIFSNVTTVFDASKTPLWWAIPLSAAAMFAIGLALSFAVFLPRPFQNREVVPLGFMQNAALLVLPVGKALFPEDFNQFAFYTFLYVLGHNPLIWSVGKALTTAGAAEKPSWKGLFPPPVLANLAAFFFIFTGLRHHLPAPVMGAVSLMGEAAIPLATFILGAAIGSLPMKFHLYLGDAFRTMLVKLVLMPAAMIALLSAIGLRHSDPLLSLLYVIQAASAPATTIILQIKAYGGNLERIGCALALSYAACAVTLPFWIALWLRLG